MWFKNASRTSKSFKNALIEPKAINLFKNEHKRYKSLENEQNRMKMNNSVCSCKRGDQTRTFCSNPSKTLQKSLEQGYRHTCREPACKRCPSLWGSSQARGTCRTLSPKLCSHPRLRQRSEEKSRCPYCSSATCDVAFSAGVVQPLDSLSMDRCC